MTLKQSPQTAGSIYTPGGSELPKTNISFFVEGEPKAQQRPRAFAKRMGNKFVARVYESGTAEGWKSQIAMAARPHVAGLTGPLWLHVVFLFNRPKSHYGTGKNAATLKDSAPVWHTSKPDSENLVKAVKDCLTQIGMWKDDSQVCSEFVQKKYVREIDSPGALIEISML